MKRIGLLFLLVFVMKNAANAQFATCGSDEAFNRLLLLHPEMAQMREAYRKQLLEGLGKIDLRSAHKTTDTTMPNSFWYDIPVVVHVVHDYGVENISDDSIFNDLIDWNIVYAGANWDTSLVIAPFKKWIGNPHLRLHLATIDPYGNQTKGITRHRSYLTYIGGDQSKLDDWPNTSYVNIWTVNKMSADNHNAAAYAYFPEMGAAYPQGDGIISLYNYMKNDYFGPVSVSKTINHEMGHIFSLYHTWGNSNQAGQGSCADGGTDDVDDTPPTLGHMATGCTENGTSLFDTQCASNYFKIYPSVVTGYDSLVDYPDTVNAQNIMDYTYCARMFTIGQCVRMHTALNNSMASRNNLWSNYNLNLTGALATRPDLAPKPEFSALSYNIPQIRYFVCPNNFTGNGTLLKLVDESWNDTITKVRWQFSNSARQPDTSTGAGSSVTNSFSQPGWVTVTMSDSGTGVNNYTSKSWTKAIFVADTSGVYADGYVEEFNPSGNLEKWPTFNYYNNQFKWQPYSATGGGYYDNSSMMYAGYDNTINPGLGIVPPTGSPTGDFDDLYSIPFNLSNFAPTDPCFLTFYYSGATRSSSGLNMTDSIEIQISIDHTATWQTIHIMKTAELANKGSVYVPYSPQNLTDWATMSINIDSSRRKSGYAIIRFRYHPGAATDGPLKGYSSGNNFYLDRLNFSRYPVMIDNLNQGNNCVVLAPNPTTGNAYLIIKDNSYSTVQVVVSDITGKVVYSTNEQTNGSETKIEIPQAAIAIKGMYIVQTITGKQVTNLKLVVD